MEDNISAFGIAGTSSPQFAYALTGAGSGRWWGDNPDFKVVEFDQFKISQEVTLMQQLAAQIP